MTSLATSVVSAAVIGGELIIGLSDGSIINCGLVQGPQGLKGDQGPMGATGRAGTDGNTIHTVAGAPDTTLGRDGDFAINVIVWEIYGPRSGGSWGAGTPLRGNAKGQTSPDTTQNLFGSNSPGSGGGGGGVQQIDGGAGITTVKTGSSVYQIDADIDTDRGLTFASGKIALAIGDGLEFDAATGVLKTSIDPDEYAKITYVDEKTAPVPYRIETDKVLRDGKASTLSTTAEIQLVDNENNFTNVKFTGLNGIGVTSDQQGIMFDGAALLGDISVELDDYATIVYSDAKDQYLQNQIDDLEVSRGKVARYKVVNNSGAPVARNGEFATNTSFYANVNLMSFGIEDEDGVLTKPMADGDIIETVNPSDGKVNRYRVADATGAPTMVAVEYVSGDDSYLLDEEKQFYIYPQNEAGVSKEYVDQQDALKLDKAGGTVTGALQLDGFVTINKDSEYIGNTGNENSLVNRKYVDDAVNTGGTAKVPVQSGAPGGMVVGSMWFDTATNSLMIKVS